MKEIGKNIYFKLIKQQQKQQRLKNGWWKITKTMLSNSEKFRVVKHKI